jgi:AcrR family transcriptional regulator
MVVMASDDVTRSEGLRERKKRLMHQLISDTATHMFLERGFDEVTVAEVAQACDISEKTVYNYFPTKESLLLDREDAMAASLRLALGPDGPAQTPVEGVLGILDRDLAEIKGYLVDAGPAVASLSSFQRFTDLIDSTPSLRAAQRDMMDRLVQVAAEAMAARAGVSAEDPEPQIAAHALLGLWKVQFRAMRAHARSGESTESVDAEFAKVSSDVRRAARLIDSGLWAFGVMVAGGGGRDQVNAAADSAQRMGRQVASALRQARTTFRQVQQAAKEMEAREREQWAHMTAQEWHERRLQAQRDKQEAKRKARRDAP